MNIKEKHLNETHMREGSESESWLLLRRLKMEIRRAEVVKQGDKVGPPEQWKTEKGDPEGVGLDGPPWTCGILPLAQDQT